MASIFTYDPDPPRVASPWLQGLGTSNASPTSPSNPLTSNDGGIDAQSFSISDHAHGTPQITRLQAEPQDGPVEYKLHLLLRPRRKFKSTSTGLHVSGSKHSKGGSAASTRLTPETTIGSGAVLGSSTPPSASTQQMRQHRLEQLTTQLLWRLQQSAPHHSSSATNTILPSLPEALPELKAPQQPAKLLHGLEESQGALYEIGVSDDGTLVGLAEDELQESLKNLRAMAACLGCTVDVLRTQTVGECEWLEEMLVGRKVHTVRRTGTLVVAEALVKPLLQSSSPRLQDIDDAQPANATAAVPVVPDSTALSTEQLRITLTGPTMSGKSTLLGTLTTSTLDNGRGKSRLSMLKHRHEITSGVTSSVTQELLGYQDSGAGNVEVINYATENIASWIDVHTGAAGSRLVFISDSAGHPRYRRTTVRGLVGWAPHWTLLCISANDADDILGVAGETAVPQAIPGAPVPDMDLSGAQLDLCLRLKLPLVVVITKLDMASRVGLRECLTKVLDALKAAGRKPTILPSTPGTVLEDELQTIDNKLLESAYSAALPLLNDSCGTVPIVLTSAVDGLGIQSLHALLHELPIPDLSMDMSQGEIFDIEDVYSKPAEVAGIVVSGRLRSGQISVGDTLVIGPFSGYEHNEDSEDSDGRPMRNRRRPNPLTSRSFPGALRDSHLSSPYFELPGQEWRRVTVTSLRNLRLPVHSLHVDQVGTIAIVPEELNNSVANTNAQHTVHDATAASTSAFLARVRKGMVLASAQPPATRSVTARFRREDLESLAVGNHVVLYICSVRASAKVVSARTPDSPERSPERRRSSAHDSNTPPPPFELDQLAAGLDATDGHEGGRSAATAVAGAITASSLLVTFAFDAAKEFVAVGDQVLVMPGGGPALYGGLERGEKGIAGLEGFVGEIVAVAR